MTNRKRAWHTVALMAAVLAAPSALRAQLATKTTGGTLEFQVISGADFDEDKKLPVVFLWQPELDPETVGFLATAECRRRNRLGAPPGSKNRLLFHLTMTPVASGAEYDLKRKRVKLGRDGLQNRPAEWLGSTLHTVAREGLAGGVLVRFEISMRSGTLDFGDTLSCACRVTETDPRGIAISSGAEAARARNR